MNDEHDHKIKGRITRLYPSNGRIFFHTEGDQHPYGYGESDYNFVEVTEANKVIFWKKIILNGTIVCY